MEKLPETQDTLSNAIFSAYGWPSYDGLRAIARKRIQELQSEVGIFTIVRATEEEEWLSAFLDSSDPADIIRRVPSGILSVPVAIRFLPFMMTVATETPWRLGRGVLDCALYVLGKSRGYLVDEIVKRETLAVQGVVCQYVRFCSVQFEDVAIVSWKRFWQDRCEVALGASHNKESI